MLLCSKKRTALSLTCALCTYLSIKNYQHNLPIWLVLQHIVIYSSCNQFALSLTCALCTYISIKNCQWSFWLVLQHIVIYSSCNQFALSLTCALCTYISIKNCQWSFWLVLQHIVIYSSCNQFFWAQDQCYIQIYSPITKLGHYLIVPKVILMHVSIITSMINEKKKQHATKSLKFIWKNLNNSFTQYTIIYFW